MGLKVSRKLFLIYVFLWSNCMAIMADNEIVFWDYTKDVSFEELQTLDIRTALSRLDTVVSIPLERIDDYLCDEQVFCMKRSVFDERDYLNKLRDLYFRSDRGSLYFSVIVNNKIVFSGLNRIIISGARENIYDNSKYPRIAMIFNNSFSNVYLRFTFSPHLLWVSILDIPESRGNTNVLVNKEIYMYFKSRGKVHEGRFNMDVLYRRGVIERIL
jgi:hypothetical protein